MNVKKNCFTCGHFLPLGEGDHVCDLELDAGSPCGLLTEDWEPTDDFLYCKGKNWEGAWPWQRMMS